MCWRVAFFQATIALHSSALWLAFGIYVGFARVIEFAFFKQQNYADFIGSLWFTELRSRMLVTFDPFSDSSCDHFLICFFFAKIAKIPGSQWVASQSSHRGEFFGLHCRSLPCKFPPVLGFINDQSPNHRVRSKSAFRLADFSTPRRSKGSKKKLQLVI